MISQTLQNCRDRKWNGDKTYVGSCSPKKYIDFRLELSNVKCTSLHCGLSILGTKVPEAKEGTASERVQDESMQTEANEGTASIDKFTPLNSHSLKSQIPWQPCLNSIICHLQRLFSY